MHTLWVAVGSGFLAGSAVSASVAWIIFQEIRINLRDTREAAREWRCLYEATRREMDWIEAAAYTARYHLTESTQ